MRASLLKIIVSQVLDERSDTRVDIEVKQAAEAFKKYGNKAKDTWKQVWLQSSSPSPVQTLLPYIGQLSLHYHTDMT